MTTNESYVSTRRDRRDFPYGTDQTRWTCGQTNGNVGNDRRKRNRPSVHSSRLVAVTFQNKRVVPYKKATEIRPAILFASNDYTPTHHHYHLVLQIEETKEEEYGGGNGGSNECGYYCLEEEETTRRLRTIRQ
jgi:hypothetical protein